MVASACYATPHALKAIIGRINSSKSGTVNASSPYHYSHIVDEMRNRLIVNDVIDCHESGRNCLVLTDRTKHLELLAERLRERIPEVMTLRGGKGTREAGEILQRISDIPADKLLTLIATGRYVGEVFDEPRLDTLFLTMPISWKGTLQQYAGRLHRLFEKKNEVQIYD